MADAPALNTSCPSASDDLRAPDPDIAGPGVIIGFLLTGALTYTSSFIIIWLRRIASRNGQPPSLLRRLTPHHASTDPVAFWISAETEFVIQLSDQQLLVGLLLIVCAYIKYWPSAVVFGADNLWTAGDIVCFSIFTHAATLFSLRAHFRHHLRLATARIMVMVLVYVLWLIIAILELSPNKPKDSDKKTSMLSNFWHTAITLEALGISWIFLIVYLPLFLSEEATTVRNVISEGREDRFEVIKTWTNHHRRRRSSLGSTGRVGWKRYNPYAIVRSQLTRLAVRFAEDYVQPASSAKRWLLWCTAELLFPWYIASSVITLVWIFSLGALIVSLVQSGLASDTWSFGQLLPAVLVLLPFQSFITAVAGQLPLPHSISSLLTSVFRLWRQPRAPYPASS